MKERDECSLTNDYETQLVFSPNIFVLSCFITEGNAGRYFLKKMFCPQGKKSSGKSSAVLVLKTSLSAL